jgi:hypothetical protein
VRRPGRAEGHGERARLHGVLDGVRDEVREHLLDAARVDLGVDGNRDGRERGGAALSRERQELVTVPRVSAETSQARRRADIPTSSFEKSRKSFSWRAGSRRY